MLALYINWNDREVYSDGSQAAVIYFDDGCNPLALEKRMEADLRVILYDLDERWEGVLRRGHSDPWVAAPIPGTARDLLPGEFERLQAETLRAAKQTD